MQNALRAAFALALIAPSVMPDAAELLPPDVTVGQNLEVPAIVRLTGPAPAGGLFIKLTSGDPKRVLLSTAPEKTGAPSISIMAPKGAKQSPQFYIQGLAKSGTVTYTASAPGLDDREATVTLAPSGIVFIRSGTGLASFRTTTGAGTVDLRLCSALLDSSLNFVAPQAVAGGFTVEIHVSGSNPLVGSIMAPVLRIPGSYDTAVTQFHPAGRGEVTLTASVPPGFSTPARFAAVTATVMPPGMAVTDGVALGRNLQIEGTVHLGEAAPAGGATITLTSTDAGRLLLSTSAAHVGSRSIALTIPPGGAAASYYLQGLGDSGTVAYDASAPGYLSRTGTITLTPSGLVIGGPQGPPDEADLFRADIAAGPHGFVANLSARAATRVNVYTVHLDPVTHRAADLTVQPLRAGVTLSATLQNSNPAVGKLPSPVAIAAGSSVATAEFTPLAEGSTEISVVMPAGFTKPGNGTSLTVIVKQ